MFVPIRKIKNNGKKSGSGKELQRLSEPKRQNPEPNFEIEMERFVPKIVRAILKFSKPRIKRAITLPRMAFFIYSFISFLAFW